MRFRVEAHLDLLPESDLTCLDPPLIRVHLCPFVVPRPSLQTKLLPVMRIRKIMPSPIVQLNPFPPSRPRHEFSGIRTAALARFHPRFNLVGKGFVEADCKRTTDIRIGQGVSSHSWIRRIVREADCRRVGAPGVVAEPLEDGSRDETHLARGKRVGGEADAIPQSR